MKVFWVYTLEINLKNKKIPYYTGFSKNFIEVI